MEDAGNYGDFESELDDEDFDDEFDDDFEEEQVDEYENEHEETTGDILTELDGDATPGAEFEEDD